jgi:hypothetical protein
VRWTKYVPLVTGFWPILAIHTTYLVSAYEGFVPWCFPYFDSCTSISATGRHGTAFYIFKGMMIPSAILLIIYWALTFEWLKQLGDRQLFAATVSTIGIIGALLLIVYVVALGAAGDEFRLQRRIGVIVYFTFTYLAQLLLVWRLGKLRSNEPTRTLLILTSYFLLATGLVTLLLDATIDNYGDYDDAFEWVLALVIHLFFVITWKSWVNTDFIQRSRDCD